MKIMNIIICYVSYLIFISLGGCNDTMTHNSVKVAIMPGAYYHTLFSITNENTLEISQLSSPVTNIKKDDFTNKQGKIQTISLSETDTKEIELLIKALSKSSDYNGEHPLISIGGDEIQACVGNKLYRSMYYSEYAVHNSENVNTALLELTYKLIELSPIDIGVEIPHK